MSGQNKPGGDLLTYLFHGGFMRPKGVENQYTNQSGMADKMYKIQRFVPSWSNSIENSNRCEGDDICDDIVLLINDVLFPAEG